MAVVFACWQESHSWDHYLTLEDIWDQDHTKWEEMSQYVALNPGWPRECMRSKISFWNKRGTQGGRLL
jgi:hypothetical protein